jgi:hypothetical protein
MKKPREQAQVIIKAMEEAAQKKYAEIMEPSTTMYPPEMKKLVWAHITAHFAQRYTKGKTNGV